MVLSDLSIKRPVFATVLSLILVVIGLAAGSRLPIREYPAIDPPIVSVTTVYKGASKKFLEDLTVPGGRLITILGVFGHVAVGAVLGAGGRSGPPRAPAPRPDVLRRRARRRARGAARGSRSARASASTQAPSP